jgi:hypothetical protein
MNNCRGRKHAEIFKEGAFYDLNTSNQSKMAANLKPGEECIVASRVASRDIAFDWFAFSHERIEREKGIALRVFYGKPIKSKSEVLSQSAALKRDLYRVFFDKNGNFKRASVPRLQIDRKRPTG